MELTYDTSYGDVRLYIENDNLNGFMNLSKPIPTNTNIILKALHRNARGKYEMIGMPWTINHCQYMETDKIVYEALRKMKNTNLPKNCPLRPSSKPYYFYKYDVDQINIPIAIPVGKYRLDVRARSGKVQLAQAVWNGIISQT